MINYELAKQLKDAGFKQRFKEGMSYAEPNAKYEDIPRNGIGFSKGFISIPTLSELIEACGDRFYSIWRRDNGQWRASYQKEGSDFIVGSTPEEAVAKLWLELNKK